MPRYPLEDKFAPLRVELDRVRDAVIAFGKAVGAASAGGAARSKAEAASAPRVPSAQAARASVSAFTAIDREAGRAARQVEGLNKALRGMSGVAAALGFGELSGQLDAVARGMGLVMSAASGLAAALPAVAVGAAAAGVSLLAIGGAQEAIRRTTGETVSLAKAIDLLTLGSAKFVTDGLQWIHFNIQAVADLGRVAFEGLRVSIASALSGVLLDVSNLLTRMSLAIDSLPPAARAAVPGLDALGTALGQLGVNLGRAAKDQAVNAAKFRENMRSAHKEWSAFVKEVNKPGLAEGIETQINRVFDKGGGKSLFSEPMEALKEFGGEIRKVIEENFKFPKPEIPAPTPSSSGGIPGSSGGSSDYAAGGFEYGKSRGPLDVAESFDPGVTALLQKMHDEARKLDTALLDALLLDPQDQNRVISSWSDFWKNLKNVFKDNPLGFLTTLLLGGQGAFGQASGKFQAQQTDYGFALGGLVHGGLRGVPSFAHFASPQGLARGGRPRGLHPSDTIPAWLAPGEFVTRANAVAKPFALQALKAINAGRADTQALAAVAGQAPATSSVSAGPGFAGGGMVGGGGGGAAVQTVAVVANEENMQRMLTGGRDAALRFFRDESANIRGALGL